MTRTDRDLLQAFGKPPTHEALAKRASRLSDRFSAIALLTNGDDAREEINAAASEGGALLKRCHAAGFISLGDQNEEILVELFGQDEQMHNQSLREFTQVSWFNLLVDGLSEKANPLGIKVKQVGNGVAIGHATSNWRLRARNFADFCHDLAETIASGFASDDEIAEDMRSECTGDKKPRHDWDLVKARALVKIQDDAENGSLGWSLTAWAKELGIPRTTFGESPVWQFIEKLQLAAKMSARRRN